MHALKFFRRCSTVRSFFSLTHNSSRDIQRQTLRHEHHGQVKENIEDGGHILNQFVPDSCPVRSEDIERLTEFIGSSKHLVVLTGAGLSTESGIPDYRSVGVGLYARTSHRPMQYQTFLRDSKARQRYWARNFIGWPLFSTRLPNSAHLALSQWERAGRVKCLITQNVDELHRKAGSSNVTELHGSTHRVICLSCAASMTRAELQHLFIAANHSWTQCNDVARGSPQMAPDGDVLLTDEEVKNFKVPGCPSCGSGILKPDVVFFGDNVPISLVDSVYTLIDQSDSLLVIGSSLFVYSGYRFVLRASQNEVPIAIVNIGPTRADHLAALRVEGRCGDILPSIRL